LAVKEPPVSDGSLTTEKNRRPLKLVYARRFAGRIEAVNFERYLKSPEGGQSKKKLVEEFESSSFKIK
jgi:predicted GIY-YIG superfamily endonuclease